MTSVRKQMRRDFVLLFGEWRCERGVILVTGAVAPLVVVRCGRDTFAYHVLRREAVLQHLAGASAPDIHTALGLDEERSAPTIRVEAPAAPSSPEATVVLDDEGVVGVAMNTATRGAGALKGLRDPVRPRVTPKNPIRRGADRPKDKPLVARQLEAELPASVRVGEEISLLASLSSGSGVDSRGLPVAVTVGTTLIVVVQPGEGLELVESNQQRLEVTEPQSELAVRFGLKAVRAGPAAVRVLCFQGGTALGSVTLTTDIVQADARPARKRAADLIPLRIEQRPQPDLSLVISEYADALHFELLSADGKFTLKRFGQTALKGDDEYFRTFFRSIEKLPCETMEQRKAARVQLETRGADLFEEIFPTELRVLLSTLTNRIDTVQILSDESRIPWELCRASGPKGRGGAGSFFLAERFSMTRWFRGTPSATSISLHEMALLAPLGSDLEQSKEEREFLLSLRSEDRRIVDVSPTFLSVMSAMSEGSYDAWHFTGHASASTVTDADEAYIELQGSDRLAPVNISGECATNLRSHRPFVFLNACQSARGGLSLTGPGGWAKRFIPDGEEGASAFVGTYWQVFDDCACAFSKKLYSLLLGGARIGAAVREARAAIRPMDDLTWLAYTVYADPNALVE